MSSCFQARLNEVRSSTMRPSGSELWGEIRSLWDWRRRVNEVYAQVRSSDPLLGWRHWCAARNDLFLQHTQSPLLPSDRAQFQGIQYFAYDPSLRCFVELDELDGAPPLSVAVGRDGEVKLQPFARTRGLASRFGGELTVYWIGGYGGGAFLPFRDMTSGHETFGGGRYLLDTIKGADLGVAPDGRQILDFNFAYNPSCSYSDQWVCPLAPTENALPSPVRAGERMHH
jgi:uncharacterized protein (DUF1684 family)